MESRTFDCTLRARPRYRLGEQIVVTFEIRNGGSEPYRLMSWDLPLEGEALNFLRVTRDEVELDYDGKLFRHGEPPESMYVTLNPGESRSVEVDISRLYPVQIPGEYTVTLEATLDDVYAGNTPQSRSVESMEPLRLLATSVTFTVEAGDPPRMTIGQAVRLRSPEPPEQTQEQARYATILFNGGTQTERDHTTSAHMFAEWLSGKARDKLLYADTAYLYKRWFGANLKPIPFFSYKEIVTMNFGTINSRLNSIVLPVMYDLTRTGCNPGDHAWTVANSWTIYLCQQFFANNVYPGFYSKTITLIHEWVHAAVGYAGDPAYGKPACLNLATASPNLAIVNADSYAAFADEL